MEKTPSTYDKYKDIPGLLLSRLVERAAPDIKKRREDTDTRSDELIGLIQAKYNEGKIDGGQADEMRNSMMKLYDQGRQGEFDSPTQYQLNRAEVTDRREAIREFGIKNPGLLDIPTDFNPRLRDLITMRKKNANAWYAPDKRMMQFDTRLPASAVGIDKNALYTGRMGQIYSHELGHADFFQMSDEEWDKRFKKLLNDDGSVDVDKFMDLWQQQEYQPTEGGSILRAVRDEVGKWGLGDRNRLFEELYANMHQVPPEILKRDAPELYAISMWK